MSFEWNDLQPIDYSKGDDKEIHNPSNKGYLDFYSQQLDNDVIVSWEDEYWLQLYDILIIDISNIKYLNTNPIEESTIFLKNIQILKMTTVNKNSRLHQYELYKIFYNEKVYDNVKIHNVRMPYKIDFYTHCAKHIKDIGKVVFSSDNWCMNNGLSHIYYIGWRLFSNGFLFNGACFDFKKYNLHAKYSFTYDVDNAHFVEYFTIEEATDDYKKRAGPSMLEMKQILANCINF